MAKCLRGFTVALSAKNPRDFVVRVSRCARWVASVGGSAALGTNCVLQQGVPLLGLIFSVFLNNTFQAMYAQHEALFLALKLRPSCGSLAVVEDKSDVRGLSRL